MFRKILLGIMLIGALFYADDLYARGRLHSDEGINCTPVQFSAWNPVQIFNEGMDVSGFRLSIFHGKNRNVYGLDLGGFFNQATGDFGGLQAGLANTAGGDVYGPQFSALWNRAGGDFIGLQVCGGGINNVGGSGYGIQVAPFANNVSGYLKGAQIAGIFNKASITGLQIGLINNGYKSIASAKTDFKVVPIEVNGVSIAGLVNMATVIRGGQVSSLYNISTDQIGVQISGLANFSDDMQGWQISTWNSAKDDFLGVQTGLVNVAGEFEGMQIGFINYCTDLNGLQIGGINIIKNGKLPMFFILNMGFSY